jgi:uncharacterized protein with PIN domain
MKTKPKYSPEKVPEYRLRKAGDRCPHCGGMIASMGRKRLRAQSKKLGIKLTLGVECLKCKTAFLPVPEKEVRSLGPQTT